jgi:hypothetical protein
VKLNRIIPLVHRNTRFEKIGEDSILTLDLKFQGSVKLDQIAAMVGESYTAMIESMYDENGELLLPAVELKLPDEFVEVKASIKRDVPSAQPIVFKDAKFKKIALTPISGKMLECSFQVAVHANAEQDGILGSWTTHDVELKLSGGKAEQPEDDDQGELPVGQPSDSSESNTLQ